MRCSDLTLPFFAPVFLPERVVDEGGGAPACYAFIARVQGALKKVEEEEEEEEEGSGCMGELELLPCERSSIVPGTFQWLPRGPCSNPSPHPNTLLLPSHTHKHINTHFVHLLMIHTTLTHCLIHCLLSVLTHFWCLSLSHAPSTFPSFLTSRHIPSLLPPPACPQSLIISPH